MKLILQLNYQLFIKIKNNNLDKSTRFELDLNNIELVNDYSVQKFNKEYIFYEIIFNGTVQNFINIMENKNYNLIHKKNLDIKMRDKNQTVIKFDYDKNFEK